MIPRGRCPALPHRMRPSHGGSVCANTGETATRRQVNQLHGFHDLHFREVSLIKVRSRDRWDAGHLPAGFDEGAVFVFACVENTEASIWNIEPVVAGSAKVEGIAISPIEAINDRPF